MNYRIDTTEKRSSDLQDQIKVFFPKHIAKKSKKKMLSEKKYRIFRWKKTCLVGILGHNGGNETWPSPPWLPGIELLWLTVLLRRGSGESCLNNSLFVISVEQSSVILSLFLCICCAFYLAVFEIFFFILPFQPFNTMMCLEMNFFYVFSSGVYWVS